MHTCSYETMKRTVERLCGSDTLPRKVLDVGSCDRNGNYKEIFFSQGLRLRFIYPGRYDGMDIEPGPNVDIVCRDPYRWENISSDSYDLVISGQCLEHVPMPWVWIKEVARVCVPGGHIVLIAPWRAPYHKAPVDCWRILPDGATALLEWASLVPVEITMEHRAETLDDTAQSGKSWGDDTLIVARKP